MGPSSSSVAMALLLSLEVSSVLAFGPQLFPGMRLHASAIAGSLVSNPAGGRNPGLQLRSMRPKARGAGCTGISSIGMVMMPGGRDKQSGGGEEDQYLRDRNSLLGDGSLDVSSIWVEKDGKNATEMDLVVSDISLMTLWLEKRLKTAIENQEFEVASSIKNEMDHVHDRAFGVLEQKIQEAAADMRVNKGKKVCKDALEQIEKDYDQAVADEDYELAMRLNEAKLAEVQRRKDESGESTKKYLLDKIDKYWLEGEISSKINQLREYQARQLQDPVNRLEHEIKKAVDDDDMPRAARAAEELKKETYQIDLEKMNRKLKSECKFKRIEDENLKNKDLIAYLEARLAQQIAAEDYEAAQGTKEGLCEARMHKTLEDARNRTRLERESYERVGPALYYLEQLEHARDTHDGDEEARIVEELEKCDSTARLARELFEAEQTQTAGAEELTRMRESLVEAYIEKLNPRVLRDLGYKGFAPPTYKVGDVVNIVTATETYRGVVIGVDERCMASDDWAERASCEDLANGNKQRFYHIVPDTRDAEVIEPYSHAAALSADKDGLTEIEPAFLMGLSKHDKQPKAYTGYVPEEHMAKFDYSQPHDSGHWFLSSVLRNIVPESPIKNKLVDEFFFSYSKGRYLYSGSLGNTVMYQIPKQAPRPEDDAGPWTVDGGQRY